eukprot:13650010-Heterocapsa_arctica.AAC.1
MRRILLPLLTTLCGHPHARPPARQVPAPPATLPRGHRRHHPGPLPPFGGTGSEGSSPGKGWTRTHSSQPALGLTYSSSSNCSYFP